MNWVDDISLFMFRNKKVMIGGLAALLALLVVLLLFAIPVKKPDSVTPMLQKQEKELQRELDSLNRAGDAQADSLEISRIAWQQARNNRINHEAVPNHIDISAASAVRTARELSNRLSESGR